MKEHLYTFQPVPTQPNFMLLVRALLEAKKLDESGQFNLERVMDFQATPRIECGAVCCVVGLACAIPDFPSKGWYIDYLGRTAKDDDALQGCFYPKVGADIFDVCESDAVALFSPVNWEDGVFDREPVQVEVFQRRLQAFFDHHSQPWPADIPRI